MSASSSAPLKRDSSAAGAGEPCALGSEPFNLPPRALEVQSAVEFGRSYSFNVIGSARVLLWEVPNDT